MLCYCDSVPIGEAKVVEINESHIVTRKYGKGQFLKN